MLANRVRASPPSEVVASYKTNDKGVDNHGIDEGPMLPCGLLSASPIGGDGTGSSSQVPVVRRAWAPAAKSYHARHLMSLLPEAPALVVPTRYREAPE
jgi:hypothetical protein